MAFYFWLPNIQQRIEAGKKLGAETAAVRQNHMQHLVQVKQKVQIQVYMLMHLAHMLSKINTNTEEFSERP